MLPHESALATVGSMPRRPGPVSPVQLSPEPIPRTFMARDYLPEEIAAAARAGAWEPVRPGAYMESLGDVDPHRRRRLTALARAAVVGAKSSAPIVMIRETAALLHGLPLVGEADVVHVAQPFRPGPRDAEDVRRRFARVPPEHTTRLHDLPVTTLERTVTDCAMSLGRREGLVIADAALHVGADPELCERILATMTGRRGVVTARWVLEHADEGSESPGESLLRFAILTGGLPCPETQIRVITERGTYWGDMGWPRERVIVEYDGLSKYEASGRASSAVLAEKRRQEALEAAGWAVIRATATDLRDPAPLLRHIATTLRSRQHRSSS